MWYARGVELPRNFDNVKAVRQDTSNSLNGAGDDGSEISWVNRQRTYPRRSNSGGNTRRHVSQGNARTVRDLVHGFSTSTQ